MEGGKDKITLKFIWNNAYPRKLDNSKENYKKYLGDLSYEIIKIYFKDVIIKIYDINIRTDEKVCELE